MPKYKFLGENIPQSERAAINDKILFLIISSQGETDKMQGITHNDIFNLATGKGGLAGLNFNDYANYHEFKKDKQEFEGGQFLTAPYVCEKIVNLFPIKQTDIVGDLTCGTANFANYVPNEANFYGCELDNEAYQIAKFLYPNANIQNNDIRFYEPRTKFDYLLGNPPFNLRWNINGKDTNSQNFYVLRSLELLNPMGVTCFIVPTTWLNDTTYHSGIINDINEKANFLFQYELPRDIFKQYGCANIGTKVICFAKKSNYFEGNEYTNEFVTYEQAQIITESYLRKKDSLRAKLRNEVLSSKSEVDSAAFWNKVDKYLYEIKTHAKISSYYESATKYVARLSEPMPEYIARISSIEEREKEWNKIRVTENRVIAYLKRIVSLQDKVERNEIRLVKTQYGAKHKAYNRISQISLNKETPNAYTSFNDIIVHNIETIKSFEGNKALSRKRREYENQSIPFKDVVPTNEAMEYAKNFVFYSLDEGEKILCKFTEIQAFDVARAISKKYVGLSWDMGLGKTAASFAWAKYWTNKLNLHITLIVAPKLASITWIEFFELQGVPYVEVKSLKELWKVKKGDYVFMREELFVEYEKLTKKYVNAAPLKSKAVERIALSKVKSMTKQLTKSVSENEKQLIQSKISKAKYQYLQVKTKTHPKRQIMSFIKRFGYKVCLIFDEADELTNSNSKRTQAVIDTLRKCKVKMLATGTFVRNNVGEIYAPLRLLYNNSINMLCLSAYKYEEVKDKLTGETYLKKTENKRFQKPFPPKNGAALFNGCHCPTKPTVFGVQKKTQNIYNKDSLIELVAKTIIRRTFEEVVGKMNRISVVPLFMNGGERDISDKISNEIGSLLPHYLGKDLDYRKKSMLQIQLQLRLLIKACSTPTLIEGYNGNGQITKMNQIISDCQKRANTYIAIGCTSLAAIELYKQKIKEVCPDRTLFIITGENENEDKKEIIAAFKDSQNGILLCTQQSLKSSVNIGFVNEVLIESMLWNEPKFAQFIARFTRFNSKEKTNIRIYFYENSIEVNLIALIMSKKKTTDFISVMEERNDSDIFSEFGIEEGFMDKILDRAKNENGKYVISWGKSEFS